MKKIIQIIPADPNVRIVWREDDHVVLSKPSCMALMEEGTRQEIVYMEMVDNVVEEVAIDHELFLGFIDIGMPGQLFELLQRVKNVKPV